jgi:1,4-alpha-glucan branching enzyme
MEVFALTKRNQRKLPMRKKTKSSQTFCFTAPGATSVLLVGDFTQWQSQPIPLTPGESGVWSATVKLAPGTYHYRFLVDGEWRDDPECTLRVPNPFGSENMVREVS